MNSEILLQNAQRSTKPPSVWNVVTFAAPASVILKRISVLSGANVLQNGVTLMFKALWFGLSVFTMLRNDPAKDASIGVAALQEK